ncbi:MAG: ABC transporter ATP-binding protein [Clostridia bacterium]|nr:ABC transporter ATP-binding protein [Clostridia bacterium]
MEDLNRIDVATGDAEGAKVRQKGVWKRFFHMLKLANLPYLWIAAYVALTIVEGRILILIPQVNGNFFAGDASIGSVLKFIGFELLNTAVTLVMLFFNHLIRYRTNRNLRNSLWGKILKLHPSYFDRVSSNTLISRITLDTEAVNEIVFDIVLDLLTSIYYLTLTLREMSAISLKASLIMLAFAPISVLLAFFVGRLTMKFENKSKFQMANLTEYLSELMSCLPLLKALNMQGYERRRGKKVVSEYYKANRNLIGLDFISSVIGAIVGCLPEIAIILLGVRMMKQNELAASEWYMFYAYSGALVGFVGTLTAIWNRSKSVQGRLNKVSDVLYEEEESIENYVKESLEAGDLSFDDVTFGYEEKIVLENVSMTFPGKQITALVGHSGAGKTTILKLLERIYEPQSGRILTGGREIASYNVRAWRENLSYVMQDPPLISGSIRENLLYGIDREVNEYEIRDVLTQTRLTEFINSLPDGLEHEVGQFGSKLSGGQRQKIAVANAILSSADVLILDEPTASLDIISTAEIVNTVRELSGKRTVILVTHDKQAIGAADHIIAVEEGGKISEGKLTDMLKTSGFFRTMMREEAAK